MPNKTKSVQFVLESTETKASQFSLNAKQYTNLCKTISYKILPCTFVHNVLVENWGQVVIDWE